ncbi:hypothetical protein ACT2CV_03040 [Pasteurellaceae bacterium 22721_9_1]
MFDSTFSKILAGFCLLDNESTNKCYERLEEQEQRETKRLLAQAEKDLQELKAMVTNFENNKVNRLSELSQKEKEIKSKEKPNKNIFFWSNFINKLK